ncbi:hypothetical protein M9Y10_032500 [Tritrichomonas musculus]|uniref:Protein kinase domain-containing protein n=1 Tax=Tritrichomonas musculus TaxID=1915356 RepID=A0ABR2GYL5_9EUKA
MASWVGNAEAVPLIFAAWFGYTEIAQLLLSHEVYKTAIDLAKDCDHPEIVELLNKGPIKKQAESKEVASLIDRNRQLEDEVDRLKKFIFALAGKPSGIQFFDFNDYSVKSVIGEGATSNVKLVIKKENEQFAMKELKDSNHKTVQRFLTEGEVLFILRHPCVLDIFAVNYGDDTHPPSLILSLEPKSLETAIENKELNDNEKCRITVELVLGMRYIHRHKFMHRDLKPSNVLLSKENNVRISDFGLAKEESLETSQSKGVGTLRFMAPELFEESEKGPVYNNKVDVYSFGITLIYIITGKYPMFSLKNVSNGIPPSLPTTIVKWVRELILSCLSVSPESRPSFADIFETLQSNNYDIFGESKDKKLTNKQQNIKKEIDERVLMIEAYEFQHQND